MGVPGGRKLGAGVAHKVSAATLHAITDAGWLAETDTDFEALATDAARSPDRLVGLRSSLR